MQLNLWFKEIQNPSPLKANRLSINPESWRKQRRKAHRCAHTPKWYLVWHIHTYAKVSVLLAHCLVEEWGQILLLVTFLNKSEKRWQWVGTFRRLLAPACSAQTGWTGWIFKQRRKNARYKEGRAVVELQPAPAGLSLWSNAGNQTCSPSPPLPLYFNIFVL